MKTHHIAGLLCVMSTVQALAFGTFDSDNENWSKGEVTHTGSYGLMVPLYTVRNMQ